MSNLLTLRAVKNQIEKNSNPNGKALNSVSSSCIFFGDKAKKCIVFIKAWLFFRFPGPAFGPRTAAGHVQSYSKNSARMTPQPGQSSLAIQLHCCQWMDTDKAAFAGHSRLVSYEPIAVTEWRRPSLEGMIDIHLNRGLLANHSTPPHPLPDGPAVAWAGHTPPSQAEGAHPDSEQMSLK